MTDTLEKIKPAVRAISAYTLAPYRASIKLNQNENPFDMPDEIKQEVDRRLANRAWITVPGLRPGKPDPTTRLVRRLEARGDACGQRLERADSSDANGDRQPRHSRCDLRAHVHALPASRDGPWRRNPACLSNAGVSVRRRSNSRGARSSGHDHPLLAQQSDRLPGDETRT